MAWPDENFQFGVTELNQFVSSYTKPATDSELALTFGDLIVSRRACAARAS